VKEGRKECEGRKEGRKGGKKEGRNEGWTEGRREGRKEGAVTTTVLEGGRKGRSEERRCDEGAKNVR
jgi:flagellar biosynthesis/type III secretory pathway protein FliH